MYSLPSVPETKKRLSKEQQTLVKRLIKKMFGLGKYTSEIKTAIAAQFHLSPRSVERYISKARHEMVACVEAPLEEHRAVSYYFYRSVIDSPESSTRDRLYARERIDKLLGADSVIRFKPDPWEPGLSPQDIKNMTDEELEAAYKKVTDEYNLNYEPRILPYGNTT